MELTEKCRYATENRPAPILHRGPSAKLVPVRTPRESPRFGPSTPTRVTFLSHFLVFPDGDVTAPRLLDDPGVPVKLALPHLLQKEELRAREKVKPIGFVIFLGYFSYKKLEVMGITFLLALSSDPVR